MNVEMAARAATAAAKFVDAIQEMAGTHGPTYAPCFRDCLGDNREWVESMLTALLIVAATGKEAPQSFEQKVRSE